MIEVLRQDIEWLEANRNPEDAVNTDREPPIL